MGWGLISLLFALQVQATDLPGHEILDQIQGPFQSVNDPLSVENTLSKIKKQCDNKACELIVDFYSAQNLSHTDKVKACSLLESLSQSSSPIAFPALLKRAQNCENTKEVLESFTKILNSSPLPRWMEYNAAKGAADMARTVAPQDFVKLATQVVSQSRSKKVKMQWLKEALSFNEKIDPQVASQLKKQLYTVAPRLNPNPNDWFAVGLDAMENHETELAIQAFEKTLAAPKTKPQIRRMAMEQMRQSLKIAQRKPDALIMAKKIWDWDTKAFKDATKNKGPLSKALLSSSLTYSRMLWTNHDTVKARKAIQTSRKLLAPHTSVSELDFLVVRIDQEEGKLPKAQAQLKTLIKNSKDGEIKELYQWHLGWTLFKDNKYAEAGSYFKELKDSSDLGRKLQGQFWFAQSLKKQNKLKESADEFEGLIHEDPFSYYSLLSLRELRMPLNKGGFGPISHSKIPRKLDRFPASKIEKGPWEEDFEWMVALQEWDLARQILDEFVPVPEVNTEEWTSVFSKYSRAHYFAPLFSRISKMLPEEKQKLLLENPETVFPKPYSRLVEEAGQFTGLWPEILWALMRQESSFQPKIVSPANAYGLMQILVPITKHLLVEHPQPLYTGETVEEALQRPEFNIPLGAIHFRGYLDKFEGSLPLAIAAYNASPEVVGHWVKTRPSNDTLVFIEDIPYEETRNYVKLVLRNFLNYLRLSSSQDTTSFPEWCFSGIQVANN